MEGAILHETKIWAVSVVVIIPPFQGGDTGSILVPLNLLKVIFMFNVPRRRDAP